MRCQLDHPPRHGRHHAAALVAATGVPQDLGAPHLAPRHLPFFKTGLLAWNGIFVISIPATVFIIQFVANTAMLLKPIPTEEERTHRRTRTVDPGSGRR